jgi:hypothetical protein
MKILVIPINEEIEITQQTGDEIFRLKGQGK